MFLIASSWEKGLKTVIFSSVRKITMGIRWDGDVVAAVCSHSLKKKEEDLNETESILVPSWSDEVEWKPVYLFHRPVMIKWQIIRKNEAIF